MAITNELKDAIEELQKGSAEGFKMIYDATHDYVYAKAKYIMKSEQDALDLTQETYIQALKGITSLEDANNVYAWLGGIVYRQGMKMFQKNKDVLIGETQEYLFEDLEATEATPEEATDAQATADIVKGMLDELPDLQRVAVLSFYYDNMKIDDIAKMCDCSSNTIKSRLNYAKKFLKEKVTAYETKNRYKLCSLSPAVLLLAFTGLFAEPEYKMPAHAIHSIYKASCAKAGIKNTSINTIHKATKVAKKAVKSTGKSIAAKISITAATVVTAGAVGTGVYFVAGNNNSPEIPVVVEADTSADENTYIDATEAMLSETETTESEAAEVPIYNEANPMEGLYACGDYTISITNAKESDWNAATYDLQLTYTNPENGEVETLTATSISKVDGISEFDLTSDLGTRWICTLMFMRDNSIRLTGFCAFQDAGDAWDIQWNGSLVILTKAWAEGRIHANAIEDGTYHSKDGDYELVIRNASSDSFEMQFETYYDNGRIDGIIPGSDWINFSNGFATFFGSTYWDEPVYGYLYVNDDGSISFNYATDGNTDGNSGLIELKK